MALSNLFSWINPKKARADRAREELKANAEKALRMKQEAETGSHIPPHQTSNEGMQPDPSSLGDRKAEGDATFTPKFKRSRVARSGDAS
jgi:hypothetical protein